MRSVKFGSTDVSLDFYFTNTSGTPLNLSFDSVGLAARYSRERSLAVTITLTGINPDSSHTDGGFVAISGIMPGLHRFDPPDAVFTSGANFAIIQFTGAGIATPPFEIPIVGYDEQAISVTNVIGSVVGGLGGNISGNVIGTVGSIVGGIGGSITGGILGSISDKVGYTLAAQNITGNVLGSVNHVVGNVSGNVLGRVGGVLGNITGSIIGNISGDILGAVAKGYNNIFHVGPTRQYTTINATKSVTSSGDMVLIHPGLYSETGVGKNNVKYYAERGVTLTSTGTIFDSNITDLYWLGEAKIIQATDSKILQTINDAKANIECDELVCTGITAALYAANRTLIKIKCNHVNNQNIYPIIFNTSGNIILESKTILSDSYIADCSDGGTTLIYVDYLKTSANQIIHDESNGGVVYLHGNYESTNGSSIGITAESVNVKIILNDGSIRVLSGLPSISGPGPFIISSSFAYNTSGNAASNIIHTTPEKIRIDVSEIKSPIDMIETGYILRDAMRLILSSTAGKLSGADVGNTIYIRDINDSKNRITSTVDASGNRSSISYNIT